MKPFPSIASAVVTAACLTLASHVSAQDFNLSQRTYLTFSGPVQMPGVVLPAGKYVFRLADVGLRNVVQVMDAKESHMIGQWLFIPTYRTIEEANAAKGKPVVVFRETPEGAPPAIQDYFYPTDLAGKEFIYPKRQALKVASRSEAVIPTQPAPSTDADLANTGDETAVFTAEPNGSQAESNPSATEANTEPNREPVASSEPAPTATSGATSSPQASNELPTTASPFTVIGLVGLLSVASGFGLRLARGAS